MLSTTGKQAYYSTTFIWMVTRVFQPQSKKMEPHSTTYLITSSLVHFVFDKQVFQLTSNTSTRVALKSHVGKNKVMSTQTKYFDRRISVSLKQKVQKDRVNSPNPCEIILALMSSALFWQTNIKLLGESLAAINQSGD